jgi:hypothetical protein
MAGRAILPSDEPGLKRASDGRDMGVKSLKTIGLGTCLSIKGAEVMLVGLYEVSQVQPLDLIKYTVLQTCSLATDIVSRMLRHSVEQGGLLLPRKSRRSCTRH